MIIVITVIIIIIALAKNRCQLKNHQRKKQQKHFGTSIEKKSEYKDPELEIQRMWRMKIKVIPVVIVVSALGSVKKGMIENIKKVSDSYCDRDPEDLHAGICTNPQEGS